MTCRTCKRLEKAEDAAWEAYKHDIDMDGLVAFRQWETAWDARSKHRARCKMWRDEA